MCNIWLQAPTLARKCEISHFIVQRNGWADGHVTTKFLGWIENQIFSAVAYGLHYNVHCRVILNNFQFLTVLNSRCLEGGEW